MTPPISIDFLETDLDALATAEGTVAVIVTEDGKLDPAGRRVNRLTRGAVARAIEGAAWNKAKAGDVVTVGYPAGMAAVAVFVVKLSRRPDATTARRAGAALAKAKGADALTIAGGSTRNMAALSLGLVLKGYAFTDHKTTRDDAPKGAVLMVRKPEAVAAEAGPMMAVAEGVFFTRDLVSEPANILTTEDFAARLAAMRDLGLEVEILEEADLAGLGMGALLGVGQGSESPSKLVVMRWNGGGDEAPFALVGKGVVFDTGGISLKPAAGMEDMTMDMGGAGVVAGVMRALALRPAAGHVLDQPDHPHDIGPGPAMSSPR